MWKIPNLNTTDIGVALNWKNPVFYTLAVVDGILIAIGKESCIEIFTNYINYIKTSTDTRYMFNRNTQVYRETCQ